METKVNSVVVEAKHSEPLFVVKNDGVLALAITQVMAKAKTLRNERGNYTVEYFCEDVMADAITAFNRYLDTNEERKNRESFTKALNALSVPAMTDPNALKSYVEKVEGLQLKYRQGSYRAEV